MSSDSNKRVRLTLARTGRYLSELAGQPSAENVHRFRTHSRRVETILRELVQTPSRNQEKLLKQLVRLRKKAGKIRDLDVQIAALRNLKMSQSGGKKAELLRLLSEELSEREEQIARLLDEDKVRELRRRLKRAAAELELPAETELLSLAKQKLEQLDRGDAPPSEKTLHHYRIVGKRARYIAELAESDAESRRFIEQLKHMQDLLGDWHDWLQLSIKTERYFGQVEKSPISAALQNVTRAKFRQALDSLLDTRATLLPPSGRKPPASIRRATEAAA